jgi:acyl carrier protein
LPAPDAELRAGWQRNYAPPRNRVEEILVNIWREVLALEQVGIHDSFFDLGGHSLLLTPLVLKLRDYFQLRLSMREFFERPTIAELAEMITVARGKQQGQRQSRPGEQRCPRKAPKSMPASTFCARKRSLTRLSSPTAGPTTPTPPCNISS